MKTDNELRLLQDKELKEERDRVKKRLEEERSKTVNPKPLDEGKSPNDYKIKNYKEIKELKEYLKRLDTEIAGRKGV